MPPAISVSPVHTRMQQLTAVGHVTSVAIGAAAQLGVADELAAGPRHVDDIAKAIGADAPSLYRLLTFLADSGVFEELEGRCFANTELGELLRSDAPATLRSWSTAAVLPWNRALWGDLVTTIRTGEPAFERVHGTGPFEYFRAHPEAGQTFAGWMTTLSSLWVAPVVVAYDFSPVTTVVDVGGGQGALLSAVLTAHPHLRGVLYDQPSVVDGSPPVLAAAGVGERCRVVGGDFFESVPSGGDAYLLSSVIHDWPDAEAVQILTNCRSALADRGRVLLVEPMLPDAPGRSLAAKMNDLEMLLVMEGGGRTESQLGDLLGQAGLRPDRTVRGEMFSLVEALPL